MRLCDDRVESGAKQVASISSAICSMRPAKTAKVIGSISALMVLPLFLQYHSRHPDGSGGHLLSQIGQ